MLSRALTLATVMLLIGGFAATPGRAQNLEAGKSPSQIFSGTCTACHKGSRGLLKTVAPGSLPGFLRQHYTTSSEMASLLSAYLISNGATDTRYTGSQPKQAPDAKQDAKPAGAPDQLDRFGRRVRPAATPQDATQQAARPDADGRTPLSEPAGRQGRTKRRPGDDATKPAVDGQSPVQAAIDRGPDGRKQRLGKKGKPGNDEPPKTDAVKDEPAKGEKSKTDTAKDEGSKPDSAKPSDEGKSDAAKADTPKGEGGNSDTTALRADPVPPVTPAPKSSEGEGPAQAVTAAPPTTEPAPSTTASSGASEPSASVSAPAAQPGPASPSAMVTSAPPPAPVAPAGLPAPPISQ